MAYDSQAQVSFKTSQRLKEKALEKAEGQGITLKALLTMAMNAFVRDELEIAVRSKGETPSPFLIQAMKESEEERMRGDVVSFDSANDAIRYLDRFKKKKKYAN